jgi:hypothetical protein
LGDEKQVHGVNIEWKMDIKQNTDSIWTGGTKQHYDNNDDTGNKTEEQTDIDGEREQA